MHDKARDDDGEAITDCVAGRKGATLKPVDDPTPSGWSALHVAGVYNTASAAAAAISNSGDVLAQDVHGRTPLHLAAANNAVETLTHMVAKVGRGNLDKVRDAEGNTPLHVAAKLGSSDAARYLLQASADARALNARGHLPQDTATTPSFALANELLQVGLLRFSEIFSAPASIVRARAEIEPICRAELAGRSAADSLMVARWSELTPS